MAPRHGFVARLILVIAVVGCLMGAGHASAAVADSAPVSVAHHQNMDHAAPMDAPVSGQHHGHDSHGSDCCASTVGDSVHGIAALPVGLDHVADRFPALTEAHAIAPAPPQDRPPDLCSLCVQRA